MPTFTIVFVHAFISIFIGVDERFSTLCSDMQECLGAGLIGSGRSINRPYKRCNVKMLQLQFPGSRETRGEVRHQVRIPRVQQGVPPAQGHEP